MEPDHHDASTPSHVLLTDSDRRDLPQDTQVRVDRERNPLLEMTAEERTRLFIRVLCELVAYDDSGR